MFCGKMQRSGLPASREQLRLLLAGLAHPKEIDHFAFWSSMILQSYEGICRLLKVESQFET